MVVILTGVKWYFIVVLIHISLIISYVKYPFICLLAICMSSLTKCQFRFSVNFYLFIFYIELYESLDILEINHLSVTSLVNIFSQPLIGFLFCLLFPFCEKVFKFD